MSSQDLVSGQLESVGCLIEVTISSLKMKKKNKNVKVVDITGDWVKDRKGGVQEGFTLIVAMQTFLLKNVLESLCQKESSTDPETQHISFLWLL